MEDRGKSPLWSQDLNQLTERLKDCTKLNTAYKNAYHKVQKNAREDHMPMKFSETQIFGDFDDFIKRVDAILYIINWIKKFSLLQKTFIENRAKLVVHFEQIYDFITTRNYDYLDLENTQFIKDFEKFGVEIRILQKNLQSAYISQCSHSGPVLLNLHEMMRLEKAQLPVLDQESRYRKLINQLRTEIEEVRNVYNREARDPPIQRNFPPYSGNQGSNLKSAIHC